MLYKDLTDKDKEFIINYYLEDPDELQVKEEIQQALANKYDVTSRTIRNWLKELGITKNSFKKAFSQHPQHLKALDNVFEKKDYYLITWIQNQTPIHEEFYENMVAYANKLDAEIITILGRYRNPTSIWNEEDEGWDVKTEGHHCAGRISLNESVDVLGDIKVRPTAKNPLTGFESISGLKTTIIGHPKLHLNTVALPQAYDEKVILTTGALTYPNYTDSKAGVRGYEKHKFGFVIVEVVDNTKFCIRQVEANPEDGSFQDLWNYVEGGEVFYTPEASAILFGDTHADLIDPKVDAVNDELCDIFKPSQTVFHDIVDGESVNHYKAKNPFDAYDRLLRGKDYIKGEINRLLRFVRYKLENDYGHIVVVRSNHDERFDRYLAETDWKKDLINTEFYLEYALIKARGEAPKGIIPYVLDKEFGDFITTLDDNASLVIGRYECGMHGHIGLNGARGSQTSFHKIDIPTITAHGHSTTRLDDAIILGTNTMLFLGYNPGPSSWSQSNAIIYKNGIAQQILIHNGRYTTIERG